jgi:hypothetical protein
MLITGNYRLEVRARASRRTVCLLTPRCVLDIKDMSLPRPCFVAVVVNRAGRAPLEIDPIDHPTVHPMIYDIQRQHQPPSNVSSKEPDVRTLEHNAHHAMSPATLRVHRDFTTKRYMGAELSVAVPVADLVDRLIATQNMAVFLREVRARVGNKVKVKILANRPSHLNVSQGSSAPVANEVVEEEVDDDDDEAALAIRTASEGPHFVRVIPKSIIMFQYSTFFNIN